MKCPECGNEDRVVYGWVEEVRTAGSSAFFERLCCYNCQWDFRGAELEISDPLVQGYMAEQEELRGREPVYFGPLQSSGSNFDMTDADALVDLAGNVIAIVAKDRLGALEMWVLSRLVQEKERD